MPGIGLEYGGFSEMREFRPSQRTTPGRAQSKSMLIISNPRLDLGTVSSIPIPVVPHQQTEKTPFQADTASGGHQIEILFPSFYHIYK
jgi:hypothetical protein